MSVNHLDYSKTPRHDYLGTWFRYLLLSPNGDYSLHMETNHPPIGATAVRNIKLQLVDQDLTKNALAIKAGIASTTFTRKLEHPEQFTLAEIGKIAAALNVTFPDLLKTAA